MRKALIALAAAAPLTLAACATTGGGMTYAEEMAQFNAECQARGGILTPIPGATGPRPANDYACEIRGGGSGRLG